MGLDKNSTRFLLYCRNLGVDFEQTAMIGRQELHLRKRALQSVFASFGTAIDEQLAELIISQNHGYAEPLLTFLGAKDVHSFDKSGYENATHLHDMNLVIPDRFKQQYTTVLDGGSLEHIFNFPVAIKNCMEMVRVGGHYLASTPANNFMGHGFYQFSPELYFSVLTPENGFEIKSMIAFEDRPDARWYAVKSPMEVRGRVTLTNSAPVYLLVVAQKLAHVTVFATPPQQSDYVPKWSHQDAPPWTTSATLELIRRATPKSVKRWICRMQQRFNTGFNPRFFRPMDPTTGILPEIVHGSTGLKAPE